MLYRCAMQPTNQMVADCTSASISLSQVPGRTWVPLNSPPVKWWLEQWIIDLVVFLLGICSSDTSEEMEPTAFNRRRNWRAMDSLPDTLAICVWFWAKAERKTDISCHGVPVFVMVFTDKTYCVSLWSNGQVKFSCVSDYVLQWFTCMHTQTVVHVTTNWVWTLTLVCYHWAGP